MVHLSLSYPDSNPMYLHTTIEQSVGTKRATANVVNTFILKLITVTLTRSLPYV